MSTKLTMPHRDGQFAIFEGADGHGAFLCPDILPLSIAWHLNGSRLGDVVELDNPAGKWLEGAIIVSADASPAGTHFELTY